jgi:hypothetical protein
MLIITFVGYILNISAIIFKHIIIIVIFMTSNVLAMKYKHSIFIAKDATRTNYLLLSYMKKLLVFVVIEYRIRIVKLVRSDIKNAF